MTQSNSPTQHSPFSVILFDLGGVLLDFSGAAELAQHLEPPVSEDQMWVKWLKSPAVRTFETGQSTLAEFADAFIAEAGLRLNSDALLAQYAGWYKGIYPGVQALLQRLRPNYRLGLLSNINSYYWEQIRQEPDLLPAFDFVFASHLLGLLKPDDAIFAHVVQTCAVPPAQILFLDDNLLNVDAARQAGLSAYRVKGFASVKTLLADLAVIPPHT